MLQPVPGLGLALGTADPPGLAIPGQGSDLWCDTGQRVPSPGCSHLQPCGSSQPEALPDPKHSLDLQ